MAHEIKIEALERKRKKHFTVFFVLSTTMIGGSLLIHHLMELGYLTKLRELDLINFEMLALISMLFAIICGSQLLFTKMMCDEGVYCVSFGIYTSLVPWEEMVQIEIVYTANAETGSHSYKVTCFDQERRKHTLSYSQLKKFAKEWRPIFERRPYLLEIFDIQRLDRHDRQELLERLNLLDFG